MNTGCNLHLVLCGYQRNILAREAQDNSYLISSHILPFQISTTTTTQSARHDRGQWAPASTCEPGILYRAIELNSVLPRMPRMILWNALAWEQTGNDDLQQVQTFDIQHNRFRVWMSFCSNYQAIRVISWEVEGLLSRAAMTVLFDISCIFSVIRWFQLSHSLNRNERSGLGALACSTVFGVWY